jgi:large subunit ribosomal protein L5
MAEEPKKPKEKAPRPQPAESRKAAGAEGKKPAVAHGHVKPVRVRVRERYEQQVVPDLMRRFALSCRLAVPRLQKICLNVGCGKAASENTPKLLEQCVNDLSAITGQKAVVTMAKRSVSNFKIRRGMKVGCRVTLRGTRMYEFFDRLVNVAIPRIRDFRGLSPRAFDGRGNYSLGLQEQTVFPEIETDKVEHVHGLDVTICTSAGEDKLAHELLKALGMPFRER